MDLVSVITPTYNSSKLIEKTVQSVIAQTYHNWELIIIDDCSIDNTVSVIKKLCEKDKRIKYLVLNKNSGAGIARNEGIKLAKGKFIAFLDSDDDWLPMKLSLQIKLMKENQYYFTYTNYFIVKKDGEILPYYSLKNKIDFKDEVKFNYVACSTVVYNQLELGKVYMPVLRNRQDWGLWLSLLKKTSFAYCIDEHLTNYSIRGDSISNDKRKMVKYHWKIYKEHLGFNVIKSFFYLIRNIIWHIKHKKR